MLKLSSKCTYALRALSYFATLPEGRPENLHVVAKSQNIPLPFLEQIFSKLKKADLVNSIRGPNGGFLLAKKPKEIKLSQIIFALEGPFEPVLCSFPENRTDDCHDVEGCTSRAVCHELDGAILNVLNGKTLHSMVKGSEHCIPKKVLKK